MPKKPDKKSLLSKVRKLPQVSGCYLFINLNSAIIYVGKAKNLRNRVSSYFLKKHARDPKTLTLISRIADIEYIITNSEVEALILENTLIKEHKPRYNVFLRDDKSYPYIKITNEPFPQVFLTRNHTRDGSRYFGPYTDVKSLRKTLRTIKKIFTICFFHSQDKI